MITPRLKMITEHIYTKSVADIGTDHAYVPIYLIQNSISDKAVAADIKKGPLEIARSNIEKYGLSDKISLRLGAGLSPIGINEFETCIIAGMGGETIAQILADDAWALDGAHLLLLQAMTAQPYLRQYLAAHGGVIQKESLCREGQRIYTVMTVVGGGKREQKKLSACCISDALLRDPMAEEYIHKLLHREQKIAHSLETAKHQKPEELHMHREMIAVLSQALHALGKDD